MIFPKLNLCGSNPSKDEINLYNTYSLAGSVLIEINKETPIKEVLTPLLVAKFATNWVQLPKYDNADELSDVVLNILDSGASKVVIPYPQSFSNDILIEKISQYPENRLSLLINYKNQKETLDIISQFNPYVCAFIINSSVDVCPLSKPINKTLSQKENFEREIYSKELTQIHAVAKKHKLIIDLLKIKPTSQLITNLDELNFDLLLGSDKLAIGIYKNNKGDITDDGKIDIGVAYSASLITDRPDNLHSTVVVDEQGVALGLAYSDAESISEAFRTRQGVYKSRSRGLWYKGLTSNSVQQLLRIDADCDKDTIRFTVHQTGTGFCHLNTRTCFGEDTGITALAALLKKRFNSTSENSFTKHLFNDEKLLNDKIMEEASELCKTKEKDEIACEAADIIFLTLTKCIANGVTLSDIESHIDRRSKKITKRPSNTKSIHNPVAAEKKAEEEKKLDFSLRAFNNETISAEQRKTLEKRPIFSSANISNLVNPIIENVRKNGDKAIKELTEKFDGVKLDSVVIQGPFTETPAELSKEVIDAIDLAFDNLVKFHKAQLEPKPLHVETCPGVNCSRYVRSIEKVGLYVPGGTAVLPSTTMHLGVPALVAGCSEIILATPPRKDGSIVPEVLYVAKKINAKMIVKAGGAQAIAAMAYGTESVPKVDKICGPGNQFVTAAKMFVQNDHSALVSIDMPAGPSEVLVIGDSSANPEYIAADLLSQAEHGKDSQSVYVAVGLTDEQFKAVEDQVKKQGACLPRANIAKYSIGNSFALRVKTLDEAIAFSNAYAPEHLIINVDNMESKKDEIINKVTNAGSVFLGGYTTESCGDYASGTNHTLPTYGYARMYSGTNTGSFLKHITAQYITKEGLKNIGPAVMKLAECESLDAHRNAVAVRMKDIQN